MKLYYVKYMGIKSDDTAFWGGGGGGGGACDHFIPPWPLITS